jgi:hypothetical protein
MTYAAVETLAAQNGLSIYGGFHGDTSDGLPEGHETLLMLGPAPDFWPHFKTSPEYRDGTPDPIDRWSTRIINDLAVALNAEPFLPFGGPPYSPFLTWALKTNRAWPSPVGMLVHDTTGLMVSYRGALAFHDHLDLPSTPDKPCAPCTKPCLTACPVNALSAENGYNTDACHAHLRTSAGQTCVSEGCLARRACPVSIGARRTAEQSAHHMSYFHRAEHS